MIHLKRKKGGMRNYPKRKIYRDHTLEDIREKAYFDISIDNKRVGRLVFVLHNDVAPRTCGNFIELVTHQHRYGYKGTSFFRIIPGFMCQGGDWVTNNGANSNSVFSRKFIDENFKLKHDGPGTLSMANSGPNTNGSQFFITFQATPWLDGKNVVFGKMVEGFDVLKLMEAAGSKDGLPTKRVIVSRCDEIISEYYGQMESVFGKVGEKKAPPLAMRAKAKHEEKISANATRNIRAAQDHIKNMRVAPMSREDYQLPQV